MKHPVEKETPRISKVCRPLALMNDWTLARLVR